MKKLYTVILFTFIGLSAKINAQIVNIPDINFYNGLIASGVHDSAGYITVDTAKAFKGYMYLPATGISDLTGIQAFTACTGIDINQNAVTYMDISSNIAFTYVDCSENNLTTLKLPLHGALTFLNCFDNNLRSLDASSDNSLSNLNCSLNQLTSLDVSFDSSLSNLDCSQNQLTSLDVSSDSGLSNLNCFQNQLANLDVSSDSSLSYLNCSQNQLTSLNVKNGNNLNMSTYNFFAERNPQLTCIEVDSVAYVTSNWTFIDSRTHFSTDCNYVLAVNEIEAADVSIYPNPATTQLIIETNGHKAENIKLYNMFGEIIDNIYPTDSRVIMDMNALPAGIYFIQVIDADKNMVNRKAIKQ